MNGRWYWFKMPEGLARSPTMLAVASLAKSTPAQVIATFLHVCDYASQQSDRGSLGGFDVHAAATYFGRPVEEIGRILAALTTKDLIVGNIIEWAGFTVGDRVAGDWSMKRRSDYSSPREQDRDERRRQLGALRMRRLRERRRAEALVEAASTAEATTPPVMEVKRDCGERHSNGVRTQTTNHQGDASPAVTSVTRDVTRDAPPCTPLRDSDPEGAPLTPHGAGDDRRESDDADAPMARSKEGAAAPSNTPAASNKGVPGSNGQRQTRGDQNLARGEATERANSRAAGTNPRAARTNPRAAKSNPRAHSPWHDRLIDATPTSVSVAALATGWTAPAESEPGSGPAPGRRRSPHQTLADASRRVAAARRRQMELSDELGAA